MKLRNLLLTAALFLSAGTAAFAVDPATPQQFFSIEKTDDMIQYEKVQPEHRIDVFDADVFATVRMLECLEKAGRAGSWFGTSSETDEE